MKNKLTALIFALLLPLSSNAESVVDAINVIMNNFTAAISSKGYINVHTADQHYKVINRAFALHTGTMGAFATGPTNGDTQFTLVSATSFSVGDYLEIEEGTTRESSHIVITAISANLITIDRPLENSYSTSATLQILDLNIQSANGSLASPISYRIEPPVGEVWHITRIIVSATDNSSLSDDKFISAVALTNGIVLQSGNGTKRVLTNWKSNSDMVRDSYDLNYNATGGASLNGLRLRWTLRNAGAIVKLDGDEGEFFEILVQDNISALAITSIKINAQGHIED